MEDADGLHLRRELVTAAAQVQGITDYLVELSRTPDSGGLSDAAAQLRGIADELDGLTTPPATSRSSGPDERREISV